MPIPTLSPLSVVGDVDITGNYRRNGSLLSAADVSAVALSLYGAKGSLAVGLSASVAGQLAVGSNGQVLTADSAQSHGVKWATVVTSVSMTVPSILSVSGSPVTSVGTLALSLVPQSANTVFAGPSSGGSSEPGFRLLNQPDIPNLDASKITTGTIAVDRIPDLSTNKLQSGILPPQRGGTGNDTWDNDLLWRIVIVNGGVMTDHTMGQTLYGTGTGSPTYSMLRCVVGGQVPHLACATGWSGANVPNRAPSAGMTLSQIIDVVRTLVFDLKEVGVLYD